MLCLEHLAALQVLGWYRSCGEGTEIDVSLVERLSFSFSVQPQVLLFTLGELLKAVNGSLTLPSLGNSSL